MVALCPGSVGGQQQAEAPVPQGARTRQQPKVRAEDTGDKSVAPAHDEGGHIDSDKHG